MGHIVPWNYPILEMCKMIAPCIAAGCTSVYKTNEWTPLSVCKMVTLVEAAGWPAGMVALQLILLVPVLVLMLALVRVWVRVRVWVLVLVRVLMRVWLTGGCCLFLDFFFESASAPPQQPTTTSTPTTTKGLLNVVHGGVPVGEMITKHQNVSKIVFTGSVRAGRAIQIAAANSNLKPVCL